MSDISAAAEAARESHRAPTGQFGDQPRTGPADLTPDGSGIDIEKYAQGLWAQYEAMTPRLVAAEMLRNATTVRKLFPTAVAVEVEDDGGGFSVDVLDADGNDLLSDWEDEVDNDENYDGPWPDEVKDELWSLISLPGGASEIAAYTKGDHGYGFNGWYGDHIRTDKYTGQVNGALFDIDTMLAAKPWEGQA